MTQVHTSHGDRIELPSDLDGLPFGKRFRVWLVLNDLDQTTAAFEMGIHDSVLSKMIRGVYAPSEEMKAKLAAYTEGVITWPEEEAVSHAS